MQLTRLDRWLRERFVHEIHVYTMREPETRPDGGRHQELPDVPGRKFRHLYVFRNERRSERLIRQLKENQQMFTTRIVDRETLLARFIAPPNQRSVTWWVVWKVITAVGVFFIVGGLKRLWDDPQVRKTVFEAIETLKG